MFDQENQIIRHWQKENTNHTRNAYILDWVAFDDALANVLFIPVNRLRTPYQTDKATNWNKVQENVDKMMRGQGLSPAIIGYDYDVHDGHHRIEASKIMNYTHIPCVVGGNNPIEVQRALEAYQEVWKAYTIDLRKSVITDPAGGDPFTEDNRYMYRGIGQKELDFIRKNGYIESEGKGNDADKESVTCFSNLYRQAYGYAVSNYTLYNETRAYILAVPKPENVEEDEHGELCVRGRLALPASMALIPVPKP